MGLPSLTDREQSVLAAVIDRFVRTASPAGSRRLGQEYELGVSAATIRNTLADLEVKGLLGHVHTSAGRHPTDLAYRYYVDTLMADHELSPRERAKVKHQLEEQLEWHLEERLKEADSIDQLVATSVRVLGLLTGELGLAIGPTLRAATLERIELVSVSQDKVMLVLTLESGVVRTVYVEVATSVSRQGLARVSQALNERLSGQVLSDIQHTLDERMAGLRFEEDGAQDLLNIFVHSGPEIFDWARRRRDLHLGSSRSLADQPEFAQSARLRRLLQLMERRELLATILGDRCDGGGPQVTIGSEHDRPELEELTIVTASYSVGRLRGTVGVIGPTRMAYDKVVSVVDLTSDLLTRIAN